MTRTLPFSLPRALGAWLLLLPGVIAFQPVFGGLYGYLAALAGVTVGSLIAVVAVRFRWSPTLWFGALLGSYLLCGGPLVLPETTIAHVVPTLETLQRLVLLIFQGWMDLLTAATPAGDLSGPAAVPLLVGLLAGAIMLAIVGLTRSVNVPLCVPLVWLGLGIAFGVRQTPSAVWLGAALGVGMLAWVTAHRLSRLHAANAQILIRSERRMSRSMAKAFSSALVIALAAGGAVGGNLLMAESVNRKVLRDSVAPPLNLQEYPSPLTKYRLYELTMKDATLFRISGMPQGARLRLAVMDTWDGNVFNVSQTSSQYLRSGRELPWFPPSEPISATIAAADYDDVWVPTFGDSSGIEFAGDRSSAQSRGLYYNKTTHQALTTARIAQGTNMTIEAIPVIPLAEKGRESLKDAQAGNASLASVKNVPEVLVKAATDWTAEATSAYQQLSVIAEKMRTEGFYSDGSDGKSRSGHTAERLDTMFNQPQWVGDDEQYATAMALIATQLGIPVRVVMGFHPLDGDAPSADWDVTGTQAHVWVEAHLDGAGWVSFDPTPDRDKKLNTDTPLPKPKPRPQVDPPPDPPERLPEEPVVVDEDPVNIDEDDWDLGAILLFLLKVAGIVLGTAGVIGTPFVIIGGLKASRTRKRRTTGTTADQLSGAWDDVVDRARDLGYIALTDRTRREAAAALQSNYPQLQVEDIAHRIDKAIFSQGDPPESDRDDVWEKADALKGALLATRAWYRKPLVLFSLRSFRRRATEAARQGRFSLFGRMPAISSVLQRTSVQRPAPHDEKPEQEES